MDAVATDSIGIACNPGQSPANRLQRATLEFERLRQAAVRRDQLLSDVAEALLRLSTAGIVIQVALDTAPPARSQQYRPDRKNPWPGTPVPSSDLAGSPEIRILASRYPTLPCNLEQWGTSVGTRSITTQQMCIDSGTDANDQNLRLISIPLKLAKPDLESLSVLFVSATDEGLEEISLLQSAVHTIERWDANQKTNQDQQLAQDTAALCEISFTLNNSLTLQACCQQIANCLHEYIGNIQQQQDRCSADTLEVFVASVGGSGQSKLKAISNADAVPDKSSLVESVEAAFGECIGRQGNAIWPPEQNDRHALLCHRRLSEHYSRPYLITMPLHDGEGNLQAAVMIASQIEFSERTRRFCFSLAAPLASTLALVGRAEQNRLQRFLSDTWASFRTRKAGIAMTLAAVVFLIGLVPLPYRIAADCEVQPATRRFVCAPFNSQLKNCLVEPGDFVAANEIVARLDEREIRMELSEVEAEFHRASRELDGYLAAHESGQARLAQLEAEKLQARHQLLVHRTDNLDLRSPIEGMVISGDLKKAEGIPLETGQTLFEIAPLQQLIIELLVPEDDIRYLKSGSEVRIRLDAYPFESWQGCIDRIHPAAEIRNDNNVFVATVRIDNPAGRLRPGMQGSAKITSAWRPISWNILHKPVVRCLRWLGW